MNEEMFQYKQDRIAYDVLAFEIDASSLESSDSHDYLNILDAAHKCFVRDHHQKVRGDLVVLDSSKANCVYELQHKEKQFSPMYQMEVQYEYRDPVAFYMESVFPQVQNVVDFGMTLSCSCKLKMLINFLLPMSYFSFVLICIPEDHSVSNKISWLHWKYDYT
jgi:hypothetical protein